MLDEANVEWEQDEDFVRRRERAAWFMRHVVVDEVINEQGTHVKVPRWKGTDSSNKLAALRSGK